MPIRLVPGPVLICCCSPTGAHTFLSPPTFPCSFLLLLLSLHPCLSYPSIWLYIRSYSLFYSLIRHPFFIYSTTYSTHLPNIPLIGIYLSITCQALPTPPLSFPAFYPPLSLQKGPDPNHCLLLPIVHCNRVRYYHCMWLNGQGDSEGSGQVGSG